MKKLLLFLIFTLTSICLIQAQSGVWGHLGQSLGGNAGDWRFGMRVSTNSTGNIIAVSNNANNGSLIGEVLVYENIDGSWIQVGQSITKGITGDHFGRAISISDDGTKIAISSIINFEWYGRVSVYENISGYWEQIGSDIVGEVYYDQSGNALSLSGDGNTIAICSPFHAMNTGCVRVYQNLSGAWTKVGENILGESYQNGSYNGDQFGSSLSISTDGSILAIGGYLNDGNGVDAGHVRVFQNIQENWVQIGSDIDGEAPGDLFGKAVSLSGDGTIVAASANMNDGSGVDAGHVRVFQNVQENWIQIGSDIEGEAPGDESGWSLSLSNDGYRVAVGTHKNDGGGEDAGHVRIYENVHGNWTQMGSDIDGLSAGEYSAGESSSISLDSSGGKIAVGSNGYGNNVGLVRVYSFTTLEELLIDSLQQENINLNNSIGDATTSLSSLQQALDTWNTTIDLSSGWNMFGYGCPTSIDLADGLSSHTDKITIVKDNNGNVYMPEFGFNGIGVLTPGYGYQIKVTEEINDFSLCDWYVNDIPEDNIVSLQDSIEVLNNEILELECVNQGACFFNNELGQCVFAESGYDCEGNINVQIGDEAFGGVVFYVNETGERGLVAALGGIEGTYEWGCFNDSISGSFVHHGGGISPANFYTGYRNTLEILDLGCETDLGGISAAQAVFMAEINGYDDWYLPSLTELYEFGNSLLIENQNIDVINLNGYLGEPGSWQGGYWTSNVSHYFAFSDDEEFANKVATQVDLYLNSEFVDYHDIAERNYLNKVLPVRGFGNWIIGCTSSAALNYNPEANSPDGSCEFPPE